jgi:hypothetical protein
MQQPVSERLDATTIGESCHRMERGYSPSAVRADARSEGAQYERNRLVVTRQAHSAPAGHEDADQSVDMLLSVNGIPAGQGTTFLPSRSSRSCRRRSASSRAMNRQIDPGIDRFKALDEDAQEAFRNALGAYVPLYALLLARDAPLKKKLEGRMDDNEKIVTRYLNDAEFQSVVFEWIATRVYEDIRKTAA